MKLSLEEWDDRYEQLVRAGLREPEYGGPLRRHVLLEGDLRLRQLRFDDSPAALRLWETRRMAFVWWLRRPLLLGELALVKGM